MNEAVAVAIVVLIGAIAAPLLDRRGALPDRFETTGPLIVVYTAAGRALIERAAGPRRAWRAWATLGLATTAALAVGSFVAVLLAGHTAVTQDVATAATAPQNIVVVPGVNQFLPLSTAPYLLLAFVVGLFIHEGCHGVLCRVEGIEIDSLGVIFLSILPFGAFVDPDDESAEAAGTAALGRVFAAGIAGNLVVAALTFGLLFAFVAGAVTPVDGVAVGATAPGSASETAGIDRGDSIVAVDGTPIGDEDELTAALADSDEQVTLRLADGDETELHRAVTVTAVAADRDAESTIEEGTTIETVDGTAVATDREFRAALSNATTARLSTDRGEATIDAGVRVAAVVEDGPADRAGIPDGAAILAVDGERTLDQSAIDRELADAEPDDEITVEALVDDERHEYDVTLGEHPEHDGAWLGVSLEPGIDGIVVTDHGIAPFPADEYLGYLGGAPLTESETPRDVVEGVLVLVVLPMAGMVGLASVDVHGFLGDVSAFYTVSGGPIDPVVFAVATALFWVGWLNLLLALFNCIPAYPLDGGRILKITVADAGRRLDLDGEHAGRVMTAATTVLMIGAVVALLVSRYL